MMRDESVYLRHMVDAIARIAEYTSGVDDESFRRQPLIQDGVIRQLEIIGEAVKHLSITFRQRHSHVPWQDIAAARDILSRHYFGVSLDEVWLMVQRDIPVLKMQIVTILNEGSSDAEG